jgi:hypothetical protein
MSIDIESHLKLLNKSTTGMFMWMLHMSVDIESHLKLLNISTTGNVYGNVTHENR